MEIKVRIKQIANDNGFTKAFADMVIDDSVIVHGVRLYEKDGRRNVSMPFRSWTDRNGEKKISDIVHAVTFDVRKEIIDTAWKAYDAFIESGKNTTVERRDMNAW